MRRLGLVVGACSLILGCSSLLGLDDFEDGADGASTDGGGLGGAGGTSGTGAAGGVAGSGGSAASAGSSGQGGDAGDPPPVPGQFGCTSAPAEVFSTDSLPAGINLATTQVLSFPAPGGVVHIASVMENAGQWTLVMRSALPDGTLSPIRTRPLGAKFVIDDVSLSAGQFEVFAHRDNKLLLISGNHGNQGVATINDPPKIFTAPDGDTTSLPNGCEHVDYAGFHTTPPGDSDDAVAVGCGNSVLSGTLGISGNWHFSTVDNLAVEVHAYMRFSDGSHLMQTGNDFFFNPVAFQSFSGTSDKHRVDLSGGTAGNTITRLATVVNGKVFSLAGFEASDGTQSVYAAAESPLVFVEAFPAFGGPNCPPQCSPSVGVGPFKKIAGLDEIPSTSRPSAQASTVTFAGTTSKNGLKLRVYRFSDAAALLADQDVYAPDGNVTIDGHAAAPYGTDAAYVSFGVTNGAEKSVVGCAVGP